MFAHLVCEAPDASLGIHAETYGRLIGSWRGTYRDPHVEREETGPMEVHVAWTLQGRAVQDVWIAPLPAQPTVTYRRRMYGTTLRVFDPATRTWRVDWWNPVRGSRLSLVGRRVGDQIVQTGYWDDRPQRWRFLDVTDRSFVWQAHQLDDDGEAWTLVTEFHLERMR